MSADTSVKVSMVKYNAAVKAARAASVKAGTASWIIGDAALTVATEYGENTLKRFADDIAVEIGTVRNFRTMAAKFPAASIARDLQHATVYGIFTSQDDAFDLVRDGNDGQPWSVSAARALVKSRKDGESGGESSESESDGNATSEPAETDEAKLARLRAYRDQLIADLAKTESAITQLETKLGPDQHVVKGIPQHDASDHRTDCPKCTIVEPDASVTPIKATRTRKAVKTAA